LEEPEWSLSFSTRGVLAAIDNNYDSNKFAMLPKVITTDLDKVQAAVQYAFCLVSLAFEKKKCPCGERRNDVVN
jgi:hypothetical protein